MQSLESVYKKEVDFLDGDCDFKGEVKVDAILKKTQQISLEHHKTLNISKDFYKSNNLSFLVASVFLNFNKKISKLNKINVVSESFKPKMASHHRLTEFFVCENDSCAVFVDTRWILVDVSKKRMVCNYPEDLIFKSAFPEEGKIYKQKIIRLENEVFLRREVASYSKCDFNSHINNTEYAQIILDSLPLEVLSMKVLKKMFIIYRKQILLGEGFDIFMAMNKNIYYVCGKLLDGKKCFEANVIFEEIK